MTKATAITRPLLKALRDEINAALEAVAEKHGIAIETGSASFTERTATFKLNIAIRGEGAEGESAAVLKAAADWEARAILYGLKKEWLGDTFLYGAKPMVILGLMPKRSRFPILARDTSTGKETLLPLEPVIAIMTALSTPPAPAKKAPRR